MSGAGDREKAEEMNKKGLCVCGRKATHFTIDGIDSVLCCDAYPSCTMQETRETREAREAR